MRALALALIAGACSGDRAGGEAFAYLDALDGGPDACAALSSADLRGECVAFAAYDRAREGRLSEALAACDAAPEGRWRDECVFLAADGAGVHGEEARTLCRRAGRWWQQCVGHAINREAEAVFERFPPGREPEALDALQAVVARYIGGGEVRDKARRLLVARIAGRTEGGPFTRASCGRAPADVCRDAYAERVRLAALGHEAGGAPVFDAPGGAEPWRAACGRRVSVERAAAAGLPTWTADAEAVVAAAWARLCAR